MIGKQATKSKTGDAANTTFESQGKSSKKKNIMNMFHLNFQGFHTTL